eukprot:1156062-Pelagomonas_calceolata.AAC.1
MHAGKRTGTLQHSVKGALCQTLLPYPTCGSLECNNGNNLGDSGPSTMVILTCIDPLRIRSSFLACIDPLRIRGSFLACIDTLRIRSSFLASIDH